jgi:hypothetical protein
MTHARSASFASACAALALAAGAAPAAAAEPGSATLGDADAVVTWKGKHFHDTATPGPEACAAAECDEFRLTVSLPADAWAMPGGVQIGVRWPEEAENAEDLDLYVYGPSGALVGSSDGFFGSSAESVLVEAAQNGVYRVVVVPRYTTSEGIPYEGLAEVEHAPPVSPARALPPNIVSIPLRNLHFAVGAYLTDPGVGTEGATSCYPEEVSEQGAHRCLRFDQILANVGEGPFELLYRLNGIATDQQLRQRIYRSDGTFTDRLADKYEFHPAHAHFHYKNFAQSRMWAADAAGHKLGTKPVRVGKKNGFCMIDVTNVWWGQKGDAARTYYFPRCNAPQDRDADGIYMRNGVSVGWADVYNWYLADQFIEVSDVPDGYYLIETEADPLNTIVETDDRDNTSQVLIRMCGNPDRAEVVGRDKPVCGAVPSGAPPPAPRIRLRVSPRAVKAGSRVRFRLRAAAGAAGHRRAVRGAVVRLGGKRARTGRRGRARLTVAFERSGKKRAAATKRGFRRGRATVAVR